MPENVNTSSLAAAVEDLSEDNRQTMVKVDHVSMIFNMASEQLNSLKEYAIQIARRKLFFEGFTALDDVSFEVKKGDVFGIIGTNGSGKSTMLKIIAGVLEPTKGTCEINGNIAPLIELGAGFDTELSARENIYLNGALLGYSKEFINDHFDEIVEFAEIEKFLDMPLKNYSSGMYVRLGFSVSIHVEPDILLVDEVLAVGDMEFQNKCMDKFAQLKDQGRTVVVVSHGLEQMRTFCDQAAWLDHGTLVDVGGAAEVIDTYSDVAHHAVEVEGGGTRFGSGEAMIERIELLSSSGQPTSLVYPGDPVRLRLHYRANERIESPVFGASIDTREGVFVWGLHGMDACYVPTSIEPGTGHLDIDIPRLTFNPGAYTISAAIQNQDMTSVIDALQKARRFDVLPGPGMESGGLVNLGASFTGLTPARPMRDVPRRGAADYEHLARMQAQQADALENED